MNYSLIQISAKSADGKIVDGSWIQHAVACTLEQATQRAIGYEGKCEVAVVAEVPSPVPQGMWYNLKRLDTPRVSSESRIFPKLMAEV